MSGAQLGVVAYLDGDTQVVALEGHHKGGWVRRNGAIPWNWKALAVHGPLEQAAPDLLAALQQATDAAQADWDAGIEPPEWFEAARAAIAKAVQS